MDFSNFDAVAQWVMDNGYLFIFLAMCLEGAIVTAASAFACALGLFNPFIIFILAFIGDVLPDAIFYGVGYWGRATVVSRFGHYFGLTNERIAKIEKLASEHSGKTLLAIKLTPMAPLPGLMAVGAVKMPFARFIAVIIGFTVPKVLFFMVIGYYFGQMYSTIIKYAEDSSIIILSIAAIIFLIYVIYNRLSVRIANRVEKI